ncbi:MAG: hypothetical protein M1825_005794 [Sarcosagium campestre]|nr:MAG: hypothetical protein M1825_005794 [Sarcosagium campestre]
MNRYQKHQGLGISAGKILQEVQVKKPVSTQRQRDMHPRQKPRGCGKRLAIARASLSASFLRPDPTVVSKDQIGNFHALLEKVISQCSSDNVQRCKRWLLAEVIPSTARITAFGKYLVALTATFVESAKQSGSGEKTTSAKRKRLHVLYIIHDLLHHLKNKPVPSRVSPTPFDTLLPLLPALFRLTASFRDSPKHQRKIRELLNLWRKHQIYEESIIKNLQSIVDDAESTELSLSDGADLLLGKDPDASAKAKSGEKELPFVIPATHGDPSIPYYDLPAGNMMPHIVPDDPTPINPAMVRPLQFVTGPAAESLVTAVKDFLHEADRIFDCVKHDEELILADVDELGRYVIRDEINGVTRQVESYYGWTKSFCENVKAHRSGLRSTRRYSRSTSFSQSKSRSIEPQRLAPTGIQLRHIDTTTAFNHIGGFCLKGSYRSWVQCFRAIRMSSTRHSRFILGQYYIPLESVRTLEATQYSVGSLGKPLASPRQWK